MYDVPTGRQERTCELLTVDADAGVYRIDEKNGVIVEAYLADKITSDLVHPGNAMATAPRGAPSR